MEYELNTPTEVDESHVVVLKQSNFSDFIHKNKFAMVEFYAPWCRFSLALAPEFAAAAAELKYEAVALAKVDATEEAELSRKFDVLGFPTVYFFVNGVHTSYHGERTKDVIVSWLKKKITPGLYNTITIEEAARILMDDDKIVLGYLESLVGPDSEELATASKLEEDVSFYQTTSPDVVMLFYVDPQAKRPSLVLLKREAATLNKFSGHFTKSAIAEFVLENKFSLSINLTRDIAPTVCENPLKKQSFGKKLPSDDLKPFQKSYPIQHQSI